VRFTFILILTFFALPAIANDVQPVSEVEPDIAEENMETAYNAILRKLDRISETRPEAASTRIRFVEAQQLWERYVTTVCAAESSLNRFRGSRQEAFEKILQIQCRGVHAQAHADHLNNYLERILPEV